MSDQPLDDQTPETPQPDSAWHSPDETGIPEEAPLEDSDWHTPTEAADDASAAAASQEEVGWYQPDAADETIAPVSAEEVDETALPGTWYVPPDPSEEATPAYQAPEDDSGWFVPQGSLGADLLAGADATIHPLSDLPLEPIPVDEETAVVGFDADALLVDDTPEEPAAEDLLLVDDSAFDGVLVDDKPDPQLVDDGPPSGPVLGTEREQMLYGLDAALAAQDPESVTEETEIAPPEEQSEFFRQADDPASVAAQRLAELEGQQSSPIEESADPEVTAVLDRQAAEFDNVEAQVATLRLMYDRGEISREALQDELRKLMLLDEQGAWWMIGTESDTWYCYQGDQWVEAPRPRRPGAAVPTDLDDLGTDSPVSEDTPHTDFDATMVSPSAVQFEELETGLQETLAHTPGEFEAAPTAPYQEADPGPPSYQEAFADTSQDELLQKVQADEGRQRRNIAIRVLAAVVFCLLGSVLILIFGVVLYYTSVSSRYADRIDNLLDLGGGFETTRIYDKDGNLIAAVNDPTGGTRISIPLENISPDLIHAVVSIEDERFYQNPGWDPVAVFRAILQNLSAGQIVSGASTITQQLAKMLVLEPERATEITAQRKIDEIIIAAEIGRRYAKNQILELYLNEINLGNLAYGAEAGARTYHDVSGQDLNLPQSALLAGTIACPATCNPVVSQETSFNRMNAVLAKQVVVGCLAFQHEPFYSSNQPYCITQADLDAAVVEKALVEVADYKPPEYNVSYPHFVDYVIAELQDVYGLKDVYRAGFNVYTTLDAPLQDVAQAAVSEQITYLNSQGRGGNNASVMVMDPRDGAIRVMLGSADYYNTEIDGQVNVALTAQQPGSSIKPIVYTAALQGNAQGQYFTPGTVIWDTQTCWGGYCPVNYDGVFHGPQAVRYALANSYNLPAVKTLEFVGLERYQETATAMGLTFPGDTPVAAGLQGALGGFDVRLYDMMVAFGVLANSGQRVTPYSITSIVTNDGTEVPPPERPQPQQVIQPEHAYLMNNILSDDEARSAVFGRNGYLVVPGYNVAAKTGTTNDNIDNWTMGYAPNVVVGVWHGNTDNAPMSGTSGYQGAAPIWNRVITSALSREGAQQFPAPGGISTTTICSDSGAMPSEHCLNRRQELVVSAQPPPGPEQDIYQMVQVDTLTNLVANEFCSNFVEQTLHLKVADQTAFSWINDTWSGNNWADQRQLTRPVQPVPTDACSPNTPQPIILLDWPTPGADVQGLVEVRGRVVVHNFRDYQIEYGIGGTPATFELVDGPYNLSHANSELLGVWDVSQLPNGPYTIRLAVTTNAGGYANYDVVVNVNNPLATPTFTPTVQIITQTPLPTWTPLFPTLEVATATQVLVVTATPPPIITNTPVQPIVTATTGGQPPVVTLPPGTDLPPPDPVTAIPIVYGAQVTGFIDNATYANYYRFDGVAGDGAVIAAEAAAGDLDTLIYLLDANGTIITNDDDSGDGTDSRLEFTLVNSGVHYIAVTRFDIGAGYTTGEFRMTLNKTN